MTEEQIKQNAEEYASELVVSKYHVPDWNDFYKAYIAGAHSRDEEMRELHNMYYSACEDRNTFAKTIQELRNPWISVEERLPEVEQYVFTHQPMNTIEKDAEYGVCQYLGGNRWWQADGEFAIEFTGSVDYWMPIQQIPKGGEK